MMSGIGKLYIPGSVEKGIIGILELYSFYLGLRKNVWLTCLRGMPLPKG